MNALTSARAEFLRVLRARPEIKYLDEPSKGNEDMSKIPNATRAVLSNGLKVANFCDSDVITFKDGNILEGVEFDRYMALEPKHKVTAQNGRKSGTMDLVTQYHNSDMILDEIRALDGNGEIDVIIVSIPVMEALKEWGYDMKMSKARTKVFDKITNTVMIDQFGSGIRKVDEPTSVDR